MGLGNSPLTLPRGEGTGGGLVGIGVAGIGGAGGLSFDFSFAVLTVPLTLLAPAGIGGAGGRPDELPC